MRTGILAAVALMAMAGTAAAQQPFVYKPIDTSKLVVQPANAVANVTGATTAGTISTIGATVANTIENNGFVRTFNNLLGRRATPTAPQSGFSALPQAGSYQSLQYPNTFTPRMPIGSTYGQSVNFPKN
ncbi:hypothetical protein [Limnoglobus roseus]|uniref:Exosortase system-associated protein, TIGR04073 family n=1 Tax=Limnoglobus roseus TaxID=2598579 RepID=A0A5C1A6Z0_9BACT|nr:hypothetical protein [Limnoglobus roseus]QEL14961.1 hypothetical protein PX52LOC_01864 [Limnoglobus roseus]